MLHLGALDIVLTMAYVGLDKQIRSSLLELQPVLCEIRLTLTNTLQFRHGLVPPINIESATFLFPKYCTYIACILADYPYSISFFRGICYFFKRQRKLPLYFYFKSGVDVYVVAILCISCILSFIAISGIDIFGWAIFEDLTILRVVFFLYVATLVWIATSVLLVMRLNDVKTVSEYCGDSIDSVGRAIREQAKWSAHNEISKTLEK